MKNILLIVITITFSIKCYGQISKGQEKLLNKAYQKNSPKLLMKFIEKWQADVKYSENDIKNDTLKCIYEMAKDILNDHSRNVTGLLFHTFDTTMYHILRSDIRYGQVDDLNFDSAVARDILKYYMPIAVFTPLEISYLYNKKRTSFSQVIIGNLYHWPVNSERIISNFRPNAQGKFLYFNDQYSKLLYQFFSCDSSEQVKKLSFLKRYIVTAEIGEFDDHQVVTPDMDLKNYDKSQLLYFTRLLLEFGGFSTIIIDKKHEWVLAGCSTFYSGKTILFIGLSI